jgi:hypothetical protein
MYILHRRTITPMAKEVRRPLDPFQRDLPVLIMREIIGNQRIECSRKVDGAQDSDTGNQIGRPFIRRTLLVIKESMMMKMDEVHGTRNGNQVEIQLEMWWNTLYHELVDH